MFFRLLSVLRRWVNCWHCLLLRPLVCWGFVYGPYFYCVVFSVVSSFAIISLGRRELVALPILPFSMLCLHSTVLCVSLQCVIVIFPGLEVIKLEFILKLKLNVSAVQAESNWVARYMYTIMLILKEVSLIVSLTVLSLIKCHNDTASLNSVFF